MKRAMLASLLWVGLGSGCSSSETDDPADAASSSATSSAGGEGAGITSGGGASTTAASSGAGGDGGQGGGGHGGQGGQGGDGCALTAPEVPSWMPPQPAEQACDADTIDAYWEACLQADSLPIECQQISAANETCVACLLSAATDPEWGPLVEVPGAVFANRGGCIALITGDATPAGCGALRHEADACVADVCAQCPGEECETVASAGLCADRVEATCPSDPAWEACEAGATPFDRYRGVATAFCGPPASRGAAVD